MKIRTSVIQFIVQYFYTAMLTVNYVYIIRKQTPLHRICYTVSRSLCITESLFKNKSYGNSPETTHS